MITFCEFSNNQKIAFLLDVIDCYVSNCACECGLCATVTMVRHDWKLENKIPVAQFMGDEVWNQLFATGHVNENERDFWWPLDDVASRVSFLTRLIRMYYV